MAATEIFKESFKRRKIIALTSVAIMAVIVVSLFIVPMSQAESQQMQDHNKYITEITNYLSFGVVEQIQNIFLRNRSDLGSLTGSEDRDVSIRMFLDVQEAEDYLDAFISGSDDGKGGKTLGLKAVLSQLAVGLAFIFSCIHMFKELSRGGGEGVGSIEMWARVFIPAVIAILVIAYSDQIIDGLEKIGEYVIKSVISVGSKTIDDLGDGAHSMREWLRKMFTLNGDWKAEQPALGFLPDIEAKWNNMWMDFWSMIHKLVLNVVLVIVIVNMMGVQVMLYSIWMELFIRKAFFPLAVADCLGEGPRSPGVLYMKRMVAVYVRIAICIMVAFIGDTLLAVALKFPMPQSVPMAVPLTILYVGNIILVYRLIIQMLLSTSGLANQIVGA